MLNFQVHTEEYRRERTPFFTDVLNVQKVVTDADGWELPPRMQNHALLLYVESGGLYFSKDGQLYSLGKGETLVCAAGVRLGLRSLGRCESEPARNGACFYLVRFDCADLHFFIGRPNFHIATLPGGVGALFAETYRAAHRAEPDLLSGDCCLLLILQAIKQTKTAVPAQQKLYDDVCAYIGKHAREDPSAAKVADALGYHKDYVCRVVKKCGGRTLGQLIAAERIGIAKGLLGSTGYPLEKIAAALNFSSANSFVKFFKYHVSMTPSEYRRKR